MSLDRSNDCRLRSLARGARARLSCFLGLCAALPAQSQTSFTASVASEYSLRGLSLSSGRAVPQLRIDHDTRNGWYGGMFASRVVLRTTHPSRANAAVIGYGGYARRLASGLAWDAGISRAVFPRDARYNYTEVYAGLSGERAGVRLFLSPAFYGAGRTAYAELNLVHPLGEGLRLSGHAGLLHRFGNLEYGARDRVDLRAAIGADIGDASVELGLQARQRDHTRGMARARALFASASIGF